MRARSCSGTLRPSDRATGQARRPPRPGRQPHSPDLGQHDARHPGPQGAVVVEHGDSLGRWHVVGRCRIRDSGHEVDDGLLRRALVPGGKGGGGRWIGLHGTVSWSIRPVSTGRDTRRYDQQNQGRNSQESHQFAFLPDAHRFTSIRRERAPHRAPASCTFDRRLRRPHSVGGVSFSITWSRLKLAAFWRGGYSWNVARNLPTYACAGTMKKTWSSNQS